MEVIEKARRVHRLECFEQGRDELNLAEFPLAAICDRFLDGKKTVVFEDTVWDEEKRKRLPRKLTISGSDRFGLPTAKDDDVLLACIQLSSLGDFHRRDVHFSRYELLKLLRWPDETRYYRRLATSLRRWKGVTIYSDRAFYDKARQSWVNKDFGIFDNLFVYEREEQQRRDAAADSWFVWNEVVFGSFQAGYLKKLDWDLYLRLKDPVAKRLYRFLDKRFYHSDRLVMDLAELAFEKVRVSPNCNTAQAKRALLKGIRELEQVWELQRMEPEKRFQKVSRGKWEAVFVRRRKPTKLMRQNEIQASGLVYELTKRNVGPACASDLVGQFSLQRIQLMIELYDWHNSRGEERGPGFIVAGIKSPTPYRLPRGFESSKQRGKRKRALNSRKQAEQEFRRKRRVEAEEKERTRYAPFWDFWSTLDDSQQLAFEGEAVQAADPLKRRWYDESKVSGRESHDAFRTAILRDHFRRLSPSHQGE